jgi:sulfate adenylyltransferase
MWTASVAVPHGGLLAEQELPLSIAQELVSRLDHVPVIPLDRFHYDDVICLAWGVFSPLKGFQNRHDTASVLSDMRMSDGEVWPIPITLPVADSAAASVKKSRLARLTFQGRTVAIMHIDDLFWLEPEDEARAVFGTTDPNHPGVRRVLSQSPLRAAGPVTLTIEPRWAEQPVLTPRQMRSLIRERQWSTAAAFQTRNPLHRAHEYVQKVVLEHVDGLVVHPLIGCTKEDDVPADVRWRVYQALLNNYYPDSRTALAGFPAAMRYAGPREAVLHALSRKNYGFTHFIVGRDHAGVGSYYHPLASQRIFTDFKPDDIGITIVAAEPAFYCRRCEQMATAKTCPHPGSDHENLSGTRVRTTLKQGGTLPPETIRPEVETILRDYYQGG